MNSTDSFLAPPRFTSSDCAQLNEVSRLNEVEEPVVTTLSLAMTEIPRDARGALARRNRLHYLERARDYIKAHPDAPLGMETLASSPQD